MYKCKKNQKTVKILSSVTVHNVSLQHLLKKTSNILLCLWWGVVCAAAAGEVDATAQHLQSASPT